MNVGVRTAPGVGGTIVVLAAWCPGCQQEVMPHRNGCCNWCGRRVYDEDRLTAREAIASTNTTGGTMTATATTATCKIDGCEVDVEDRVGRYAKLCTAHKQEARAAASSVPVARSSSPGGASLVDQARAVVPLARKVDRARAQLAQLPSSAGSKAAFDEATRRASAQPTAENLARVGEATKDLLTFAPRRAKLENDAAHAERALELAVQVLRKGHPGGVSFDQLIPAGALDKRTDTFVAPVRHQTEEFERDLVCTGCGQLQRVCGMVDDLDAGTYRGVFCGCRDADLIGGPEALAEAAGRAGTGRQ